MKILVTGGSGFLGFALCKALLAQGHVVVSFQRNFSEALHALNVQQVLGHLHDEIIVREALKEVDAVLHNAAKASAWGAWQDFYQTNVRGTEILLHACKEFGIQKFVYTSTPSVVHRGRAAVQGGNELNTPYADQFSAHYPHSKMLAEKMVLAANSNQMATVALRPRLIWGPGDSQLLPRLVARAKAGRLRFIGNGKNKMDCTYIDNVVHAHLLALQYVSVNSACAGKAYFISNAEPKPIAEIVNAMLSAADVPSVHKCIPFWLAFALGTLCEMLWRLTKRNDEPPITRFMAEQLSTEHWYDCSAAKRDFSYQPLISFEQGMQNLRVSLKENKS